MAECILCAGTGELITCWEEYLSPPSGAPADHATEPCHDCNGTGQRGGGNQADGIKRLVGPTILLRSGEYFDFESPETSIITIGDIAHALSNLCRFTGHVHRFYSVAEHSIHASYLVPPEDAFAALMHDAAEAVLGDVSKPLKSLLPDYKRIEQRVERAIFARFGLPGNLPASIKVADRQMLGIEQRECMGNSDDWGRNTLDTSHGPVICFLSPPAACGAFLARYSELRGVA